MTMKKASSKSSSISNTTERQSLVRSPGHRFLDGEFLVEEQICAILSVEEAYQVQHVPCQSEEDNCNPLLGDEWRQKICQWSFRVIDHFQLDREVVSFGLNIFDRFLVHNSKSYKAAAALNIMESSKNSPLHRRHRRSLHKKSNIECVCPSCAQNMDSRTYQLAAMTSLYIAIKLHPDNTTTEDGMRRRRYFKLSSFIELSRGQFDSKDIAHMETNILTALNWKVNPPTPMALVAYLLCLMPPQNDIPQEAKPTYDLVLHVLQELSRYITELSVCLGGICTSCPASYIAYAAIQVSMDLLTLKTLPTDVRDIFHANVTMISLQSGGTLLLSHKQTIQKLKHCLSKSLQPELLLDDLDASASGGSSSASSSSSSCHPIIIARDYGLLNLNKIQRAAHKQQLLDDLSESYQNSPTGVVDFP